MKIKMVLTGLAGGQLALLTGCFSPTIEVTASPEIEKHFGLNPSFEVDIAVLTAEEANQMKSLGADAYFAANSPLRESLKPATLMFSRNLGNTSVLKRDNPCWKEWGKKDAEKLLLTVNLPSQKTNEKIPAAAGDGRVLILDYEGKTCFPHTLQFQVNANGLTKMK